MWHNVVPTWWLIYWTETKTFTCELRFVYTERPNYRYHNKHYNKYYRNKHYNKRYRNNCYNKSCRNKCYNKRYRNKRYDNKRYHYKRYVDWQNVYATYSSHRTAHQIDQT